MIWIRIVVSDEWNEESTSLTASLLVNRSSHCLLIPPTIVTAGPLMAPLGCLIMGNPDLMGVGRAVARQSVVST